MASMQPNRAPGPKTEDGRGNREEKERRVCREMPVFREDAPDMHPKNASDLADPGAQSSVTPDPPSDSRVPVTAGCHAAHNGNKPPCLHELSQSFKAIDSRHAPRRIHRLVPAAREYRSESGNSMVMASFSKAIAGH